MRWMLLALAACYAPSPPAGAPCAADLSCPGELVCVADVCVAPGQPPPLVDAGTEDDARPDGAPDDGDRDDDGVPDLVDGCPDAPDPAQHDEDGDGLGDACDPCPPFVTNDDADGDGVGDACDPHPATGGDVIARFEGFGAGVPAGWSKQGIWMQIGDGVATAVNGQNEAILTPPGVVDSRGQVSAKVLPVDVTGPETGFGVQFGGTPNIFCGLIVSGGDELLALIDPDDNFLDDALHAWNEGMPYVLALERAGSSYGCVQAGEEATAASNRVPAPSAIAFRTRGVGVLVEWFMHVDSP